MATSAEQVPTEFNAMVTNLIQQMMWSIKSNNLGNLQDAQYQVKCHGKRPSAKFIAEAASEANSKGPQDAYDYVFNQGPINPEEDLDPVKSRMKRPSEVPTAEEPP